MSITDRPLDTAELSRLIRQADPDAFLVPARLVRRVIKRDRGLTGFGFQVPHRKCFVVSGRELRAVASPDELGICLDGPFPDSVILIAAPTVERLAKMQRGPALTKYWRLLFHARVHGAIAGRLGAAGVRKRINALGRPVFDEACAVLRLERFLLPPADHVAAYEEFAAVFLELYWFTPILLATYFPAIDDPQRTRQVFGRDLDDAALFNATRLNGAPMPKKGPETPEPPELPTGTKGPSVVGRFARRAERAQANGNAARAAILWTGAGNPEQASDQLAMLAERLWIALGCANTDAGAWRHALSPLLTRGARGFWPAEVRLLYDLQALCVAAERPVAAADFAGWLRSGGLRPLERSLPLFPAVTAVRQLSKAVKRLPATRLKALPRDRLGTALGKALSTAEEHLRDRLRPKIDAVLRDVGLEAANDPEAVASQKLTEELLDHVVSDGFLTLGNLRDAVARNQLKLQDLAGAREWWKGDALLAANRELPDRLVGVYRFGEVYLRWLQRLSSLVFGTPRGRWVTLNLIVPFGGAFLAVEGPLQIIHEIRSLTATLRGWLTGRPREKFDPGFPIAPWALIGLVAVGIWLLLHVPAARHLAQTAAQWAAQMLRRCFIEWPLAWMRSPLFQRAWSHPVVRGLWQFAVKPIVPALAIAAAARWLHATPAESLLAGGLTFGAISLSINSQLGRDAGEIAADWATRRLRYLRDLLPGIVRWFIDLFKRLLEWIDRGLYAVDEWLRFRAGDGRWSRGLKTLGGLVWCAVAYVVRFVVVLFIEPQVNPVKHFPVVTISHKLLLPLIPAVTGVFEQHFGFHILTAGTLATLFIGKIPGVFGFLVWEFKENWRLYRANRPATLRPVRIGRHGETMSRLLRPGFHSGTLPKLFAKLRRAERRRNHRAGRRLRATIDEVQDEIGTFVERELIALLRRSDDWRAAPVFVSEVDAATNRIRIALSCAPLGPKPLRVTFVEGSGWLTVGITETGWLANCSPAQRAVLDLAVKGAYHAAGVDLVREQIASFFAPNCPPFDVTNAGLILWPGPLPDAAVLYDLRDADVLQPHFGAPDFAGRFPTLQAAQLIFSRRGLPWHRWVAAWDAVRSGKPIDIADAPVLPDC